MSRLALLFVVVSWVCGTVADAQMGTRYDDPPSGNGLLRNDYEGSAGTLPPLGNPPAGNVPVGTSPSATNPEAQGPAAGSAYQSTTQGAAASPSTSAATAGASSLPNQMASRPATSQEAETIMAAALRRHGSSKLAGTPVTLEEVVATAATRAEQSARVNCYWDLCSAVSDYYLGLHEQGELQAVAAITGGTSPVMRGALDKLQRRLDTALTAARASQSQLASLMGRATSAPLPADLPLCVSYGPKFSQNFPGAAPPEAVALNQLLPLRHAELLDAASNVERSQQYYDLTVQRWGQNLAAGEAEIVKALELLALNRRAFVQIGRDYNRRITRYTELAKPGTVGSQRLVAMLIKTDPTQTARQNRAESPYGDDRRSSEVTPPPTFRAPSEPGLTPDEGVQPAGYDEPRRYDEPSGYDGADGNGANGVGQPDETSVLRNGGP